MISLRTAGKAQEAVETAIAELVEDRVASRIFEKDASLWGEGAEPEASIRLGWVSSPTESLALIPELSNLRAELLEKGLTRIVLCGMGGSSLAPEVFARTNQKELLVLDTTDPSQIQDAISSDLDKTIVVVSSKSGSTVETDSQKRIFEKAFTDAGIDKSQRIIVVTDPGSPMEIQARLDGYRIFNADPTVGGRYSALTAFGLVPSFLAGVDMETILRDAVSAAEILRQDNAANPGLRLGAALARTIGRDGYKDKLGIVPAGSKIIGFGDWIEQLIAESTGKDGKGILPISLEPNSPEVTAKPDDLLLCGLVEETDEPSFDLEVAGTIGEQMMLWEVATVVASRLLGINPFDQPDVESAKIAARKLLTEPAKTNSYLLSEGDVRISATNLDVSKDSSLADSIQKLMESPSSDSYFCLQVYLNRNKYPAALRLRDALAKKTGRPVAFGWGPRFLHSTGQYHKGGPKQGIFLQITLNSDLDVQVPGRDFSFQELINSQAQGDARVLAETGRPVLTINTKNPSSTIDFLLRMFG